MTEEDAETKWCPFVRVDGDENGASTAPNRWPQDLVGTQSVENPFGVSNRCISSQCMAWRWAGYRAKDGTWVRKTADGPWDPANADGFCGLAGPAI